MYHPQLDTVYHVCSSKLFLKSYLQLTIFLVYFRQLDMTNFKKEVIMKYVYASRTGNVEEIVNSLGLDALRIEDGSESVDEPYILFTYTDGYGDVPAEVENFLMANGTLIQGVVCSGDTGYGDAYCQAADKISEEYGCEILYKVENAGTPEDIESIKKAIGA